MTYKHNATFTVTFLAVTALLLLSAFAIAVGAQRGDDKAGASGGERAAPRWTVMNRLEGPYRISYDLAMLAPNGDLIEDGRLTIDTKPAPGGGYKVYVLYRVGDITGGLTLSGADKVGFDSILIPALVKEPALDLKGIKLLAAPVYFLTWQDNFRRIGWAEGAGWLVRDANPEVGFSVSSSGSAFGRNVYRGMLRLGNREVLDIQVSPEIPLPVNSSFRDRDGTRFECEMVEYKEGQKK